MIYFYSVQVHTYFKRSIYSYLIEDQKASPRKIVFFSVCKRRFWSSPATYLIRTCSWINIVDAVTCVDWPRGMDLATFVGSGDHHYICNPHHGTHIYCVKKTKRPKWISLTPPWSAWAAPLPLTRYPSSKTTVWTHGALLMWHSGLRQPSQYVTY